jgi:hypothetical protein
MTERQPGSRHGLNAPKARVKVRGLVAIDRRTAAAQALLAWRKELLTDLGGEATVSAQEMALVEAAVRTRLYVDALDAWLLERGSLVNARRRAVHPVVRERQQLVDSLARLLSLLGLERRAPKAVDLSTYLRTRYREAEGSPSAEPDTSGQISSPSAARVSGDAKVDTECLPPRRVTPCASQ